MEYVSKVINSVKDLITILVQQIGKNWTIFFIFAIPCATYFGRDIIIIAKMPLLNS